MAVDHVTIATGIPVASERASFARFRVLEGSSELLLSQFRLHAKRVRALAAAYRRETRRLQAGVSPELARIDVSLDRIAQLTTVALGATDTAFVRTFSSISAMDYYFETTDVEHPEFTPAQRIAAQSKDLLDFLRGKHAEASEALRAVVQELVVNANNLAIVVGQPGAQPLEHFRVIIRQMRTQSGTTYDLGGRLDVFVQNLGATLQELAPTDSFRNTVLASLRSLGAQQAVPGGEGAM